MSDDKVTLLPSAQVSIYEGLSWYAGFIQSVIASSDGSVNEDIGECIEALLQEIESYDEHESWDAVASHLDWLEEYFNDVFSEFWKDCIQQARCNLRDSGLVGREE